MDKKFFILSLIVAMMIGVLIGSMLMLGWVIQMDLEIAKQELAKQEMARQAATDLLSYNSKEAAAWSYRETWLRSTNPAEKAEYCAILVRIKQDYADSLRPELALTLPTKESCLAHPDNKPAAE